MPLTFRLSRPGMIGVKMGILDRPDDSSNPVAPTIFLASLFCGSFWGFTWFNRKVEFSLFIA